LIQGRLRRRFRGELVFDAAGSVNASSAAFVNERSPAFSGARQVSVGAAAALVTLLVEELSGALIS
jgi:VIT1/CCC1 family predicted Fe2+/Mn2+ transporter